MSKQRMTIRNPSEAPVTPAVRGYGEVAGAKQPQPDVINLEIDENDDFGSDPYNCTGSHCVLKIDDGA